jgi:hypothetical protein
VVDLVHLLGDDWPLVEVGAEDLHVARQHDQLDVMLDDQAHQLGLCRLLGFRRHRHVWVKGDAVPLH